MTDSRRHLPYGIRGEERKRLRTAVQSIRPRNFGIIIRTVAEHKSVEELSADLDMLRYRWDTTVENLFASKAPVRLAQEENRIASLSGETQLTTVEMDKSGNNTVITIDKMESVRSMVWMLFSIFPAIFALLIVFLTKLYPIKK